MSTLSAKLKVKGLSALKLLRLRQKMKTNPTLTALFGGVIEEAAPASPATIQGAQAAVAGLTHTANPYPRNSQERIEWNWGYNETRYAEAYQREEAHRYAAALAPPPLVWRRQH